MERPASLPAVLVETVATAPERTFIHFEGESYSYRRLAEETSYIASCLNAWPLRRGERVALYLENSPSFVAAYLGVLWLGGVVVPVNTRYRAGELRHLLNDAGARLVVTDRAGRVELETARPDLESLEAVVEVGEGLERDRAAWAGLAEGGPLENPVDLAPDDLAVIGYTSGTTGRSKGAMLTHGNFLSNSRALTRAWRWTASDHLLLVLPLFHMHGLGVGLHGTLVAGAAVTLHRKFEAEAVYARLLGGDVTMFFGVPTMYTRLLEHARGRGDKPAGLRLLVSGSAPLSPHTHAEVERTFGLRILERYGMTETVMNLGNPYAGERRAGSVGQPFAGVEVRVADGEDRPLPAGETGELQLRGPNVCAGYWRQREATEAAWTADGWFRTGDLGYLDDGYYYLSGRAKDLVISGGFNVYPREVEEVIAKLPGVREVAVLGLNDADLGERVVAAVVGEVEAATVIDHVKATIAPFKAPKEVFSVDGLPRNALGKVQKHLLRELLSKRLEAL